MEQQYREEGEEVHVEGQIATCYHKIEELESYNINKTDITKLKAAGFHTIEAVYYHSLNAFTISIILIVIITTRLLMLLYAS